MRACSEGGSFETEITSEESGVVVSASGQLPCPFAFFHPCSQLVPRSGLAGTAQQRDSEAETAMDCRCGAVPMSEIETVLLDPRNNTR